MFCPSSESFIQRDLAFPDRSSHEHRENRREEAMNIFNVSNHYFSFIDRRNLKPPIAFEEPRSHDMTPPGKQ